MHSDVNVKLIEAVRYRSKLLLTVNAYVSNVTSAEIAWLTEYHIWACVWDSWLQRTHIQISSESQLKNAFFLLGLLLKYAGWQKIIFLTSFWDSGFHRTYIQFFGEYQFSNAPFLLRLLLKYAGLQKTIFCACLEDSGFQQTHIQSFSESQF